jgi:CRP-like cAMP-binding protein
MTRYPLAYSAPAAAIPLLLQRLQRIVRLTEDETALVLGLANRRRYDAGEDMAPDEASRSPELIASGWGCRQRVLSDGRRQIFCFTLPGDFVGLSPRPLFGGLSSSTAVTPIQTLDATPLRDILDNGDPRYAGLRAACKVLTMRKQALLMEQVIRLGRLTAYERTAHLLLELRARLSEVGLTHGDRFPLPLTQETMADHLGLSIVHVNRTLQQLRRERMIELKSGWVTLLQPELLVSLTDFRFPALPRA